jgi:hypothetical protein
MEPAQRPDNPLALLPPTAYRLRPSLGRHVGRSAAEVAAWQVLVFVSLRSLPPRRSVPHPSRWRGTWRRGALRIARREQHASYRRLIVIAVLLVVLALLGIGLTENDGQRAVGAEGAPAHPASVLTTHGARSDVATHRAA